jgi:DNA replication protein DnaC
MSLRLLTTPRFCPAPVRAVPRFGEATGARCRLATEEELAEEAARLLEVRRRQVEQAMGALSLPEKEIQLYCSGLDRRGRGWRETRAVRDLRALIRRSLVVVLWGPVGTGKSAAACRVLAELCRVEIETGAGAHDEVDVWADGTYLRAPDYARVADWEEDRLEAVWRQRHLVIDDLGEEQELGEKACAKLRLLLTRRDDEVTSSTRTIITSNLTPTEIGARYGKRVFDRLGETGAFLHATERIRPQLQPQGA